MEILKSYSGKTHQGPYLQVNEDDYDIDLQNHLFSVYDGFGGSGVGDNAVAFVKKTIREAYAKLNSDPDSTLPYFFNPRYLLEVNALVNAIKLAHQNLKRENTTKEINLRAGMSFLSVVFTEKILSFVSVGNCVAYLARRGNLELVVPPDILHPYYEDRQRQFKLYPLNALGLFDEIEPQVKELRIEVDDQIILLSDGIYGTLGDEEIKFVLNKKNEKGLPKILEELFQLANEKGNLDNQTGIILRF